MRRPRRHSGDVNDRTRRRFARRQWARRWRAWRWVLAAVAVLALVVGVGWLFYGSSELAVEKVTVTGTSYLDADQVRKAADIRLGEPLARVDLDAVANRVGVLAPVKSVDVTRSWPHGISIAVTERQAVAVVDVGGVPRAMDDEGELFREYATAPADLPVVRTGADADNVARAEAAKVLAALPDALVQRLDHLEVASVDEITLVLRDGRVVVWGSAEDSAQKAEVLAVLLKQPARQYDVSVPGQPTTRS